jgi:signal transduction histidine kinase
LDHSEEAPGTPEARFARLVSLLRHELLTPLGVIEGFAELLDPRARGHPPGPDDLATGIAAIRRNVNLAVLIVTRLHGVEHVMSDAPLHLDREPLDLVPLVTETISDVRRTVLARHPTIVDHPDSSVDVAVDPSRIRQVLFNLLSNAAKYSDTERTIRVQVRSGDDSVEVAVTDEGEGIAPADIEEAFRAFTRLSDERSGTGLGLAISRAIARAHEGDLQAQPAPDGPGSRFILTLPLA